MTKRTSETHEEDPYRFEKDLLASMAEAEGNGSRIPRGPFGPAMEFGCKIAGEPVAFFFELQTHALRALKRGDNKTAIESLDAAIELETRHPEEMAGLSELVHNVRLMIIGINGGAEKEILAVLQESEDLVKEVMRDEA